MNERMHSLCEQLRAMRSDEAATWLMETYDVEGDAYGEAFSLIPHRSWKRADQLRLARYYLQRIPFASARPYEAFAAFMSIRALVDVIVECLPHIRPNGISLLRYHLGPLIEKRARTPRDVLAGKELWAKLKLYRERG